MARSESGDSIVDRVVRILEAFDAESPALTVGEIAARAGLSTSTTSRIVEQLVGHDLLRRDQARKVRVGLRMWELANRASPSMALRQVAMPFMEDLHAIVGHHTQLGVLDGSEVLFIERLSTRHAVINITRIAGRLPLHASSAGLVLLAHAPHKLREHVLATPMREYTTNTITDPAELRRVLANVRQQGFSFCPGHIDLAATGIAVPVRDSRKRVIAAMAVVVPNDAEARSHIGVLRSVARGLERILSGLALPPGDLLDPEAAPGPASPGA